MNHWKSHRTTIFLSLLFLVLSLTPVAFGQTPSILGGAKERQPSYGELENFTILSYSDLDGWDQAAEFRVSKDGKHAYISNYQGFSILDVSDPARPKVVSKIKNDPSVQSQYIDVLGNLLVVNQEGVRTRKTRIGLRASVSSISPIRQSRARPVFLRPTHHPIEASMDFGSTKTQSKASSHLSQPRCKDISARFY